MFQFTNPIWLFAIGGIVIPLIIHLWNVKKGRTLLIGSIRLFSVASKQSAKSLRLMDLLRLLLRCLILITAALLLAEPVFTQKTSAKNPSGWILIDPNYLQEGYSRFQPEIDSLLKSEYETRYFQPGFEPFDLSDTAETEKISGSESSGAVSYWSLVKALDEKLPLNATAYIYSNSRQSRISGSRPQIASKVVWKTFSPADSLFNKIESAYLISADSLKLNQAHSNPRLTTYSTKKVSLASLDPAYELTGANEIRFRKTESISRSLDTSSVKLDTATIRIALFTDQFGADLAYLKAALEAIKMVSERKISIRSFTDPKEIPAGSTWLFWLSESQPSQTAKNIFAYQEGKILSTYASKIISKTGLFHNNANALYKRKLLGKLAADSEVLWEDESGNPILTTENQNTSSYFRFYTRFDPEWNELPWSARFPEMLMSVLSEQKVNTASESWDRRMISDQQLLPSSVKTKQELTVLEQKQQRLDKYFWLLLVLLFALERLISGKRYLKSANG